MDVQTEDQIKHMVDRFLSWRLPENFAPDGGIIFKAAFNEHTAHPMKHEPTGTNLFDATQADAMVRHMIEGIPSGAAPADAEKYRQHVKNLVKKADGVSDSGDAMRLSQAAVNAAHAFQVLCEVAREYGV